MESINRITKKEYVREITEFKECKDLHYFLMNVLSLILSRSYYYCFCEKFEGPHLEFSGLRK